MTKEILDQADNRRLAKIGNKFLVYTWTCSGWTRILTTESFLEAVAKFNRE